MPSQMQPEDAIRDPSSVPPLVKRGVMSAMKTAKGNDLREKFGNAFNIVVWRLTEGLKDGTKTKKHWRLNPANLKLTKLGLEKQNEKRTDKAAVAKIRAFNRLVADLKKDLEREEP